MSAAKSKSRRAAKATAGSVAAPAATLTPTDAPPAPELAPGDPVPASKAEAETPPPSTNEGSPTSEPIDQAAPESAADVAPDEAPAAGDGASLAAALGVDLAELALQVEAVLLTTDRPLSAGKLSETLGQVGAKAVAAAVAELNRVYETSGRSFRIEQLAGGYQMLTLPRFAEVLAACHKTRLQMRLTPAALETLAIVAYKQPILRADIEAIRGVACGEVLRSLMERRLVKIAGRAEVLGRPMLYGTTKTFLELFGLASVKDLPGVEELKTKGQSL